MLIKLRDKLRDLFRKISALIEEMGLFKAVAYKVNLWVHDIFGQTIFFYYKIVVQPVAEKPYLPARLGRSITVSKITAMNAVVAQLPVPVAVLQSRFAQQAICFLATKEDAIVGCIWICRNGYREDEVRCKFVPSPSSLAVWDFDVYIAPHARSGIAFVRLWDEVNSYFREHNVQYTVSRISAFNMQSNASHARMGAKIIGGVMYFRIHRAQLMLSQFTPRVHFSWREAQVPSVVIRTQRDPH